MDTGDCLGRLRADLPLMPAEVVDEWLKPYAELLGWPPEQDWVGLPVGRWLGILSRRRVGFWARVEWRMEEGCLEFADLAGADRGVLLKLQDAHYGGVRNEYSEIVDGRTRLLSILKFIFRCGRIPGSIVLLRTPEGLSVVDGHHRLVAYFLSREPRFRKMLPEGAKPFDPTLRKWIGVWR